MSVLPPQMTMPADVRSAGEKLHCRAGRDCLTCRVGTSLDRQVRSAADVARVGTPYLNSIASRDNKAACKQYKVKQMFKS